MKVAELRAVVEAMTDRPWHTDGNAVLDDDENVVAQCHDVRDIGDGEHNAAAVATLANHSDALVGLLEACELWRDATELGRRATTPALAQHRSHEATEALLDAIARVHAVE